MAQWISPAEHSVPRGIALSSTTALKVESVDSCTMDPGEMVFQYGGIPYLLFMDGMEATSRV